MDVVSCVSPNKAQTLLAQLEVSYPGGRGLGRPPRPRAGARPPRPRPRPPGGGDGLLVPWGGVTHWAQWLRGVAQGSRGVTRGMGPFCFFAAPNKQCWGEEMGAPWETLDSQTTFLIRKRTRHTFQAAGGGVLRREMTTGWSLRDNKGFPQGLLGEAGWGERGPPNNSFRTASENSFGAK